MRSLTLLGAVLLILGVLAFVVPVPHNEDHSVKIGNAKLGIQTEHRERLPPALATGLVVAGVVALALGMRETG